MRTLRNIMVAALLTVAGVMLQQEPALATVYGCDAAAQMCSIVPGYFLWTHPNSEKCVDAILMVDFDCAPAAGTPVWRSGTCAPVNPSTGLPTYCGMCHNAPPGAQCI